MVGLNRHYWIKNKPKSIAKNDKPSPGTGEVGRMTYGLPPLMAIDIASSYLLNKARLNLAEKEMERMKDKTTSAGLLEQLADVLKSGDKGE